ncbi:MAG: PKD domain-containing protein [Bacteroidetes bacterium]|nr:PKD domain-containing protein [Bacteroidota bacterium]MBU1720363.1 PKD domain-containing protein [Bacteroidota bacterium]
MKKTIALLIAVAVVAASCQKKPDASFTTDKESYTAGETVKLTNTSVDGKSYLWTFPDGQTSVSRDVDYTLDASDAGGQKTIQLEVFSKNGKKKDAATKTINVSPKDGKVVFWKRTNSSAFDIAVTINGVTKNVTSESGSIPDCDATGCASFDLAAGTYNYSANDGYYSWNGSITVERNTCSKIELIGGTEMDLTVMLESSTTPVNDATVGIYPTYNDWYNYTNVIDECNTDANGWAFFFDLTTMIYYIDAYKPVTSPAYFSNWELGYETPVLSAGIINSFNIYMRYYPSKKNGKSGEYMSIEIIPADPPSMELRKEAKRKMSKSNKMQVGSVSIKKTQY